MRIAPYIIVVCLSAFVASCQNQTIGPETKSARIISAEPDEFEKNLLMGNVQLVDVRTLEEFNGGHISGALNYDISSAQFNDQISLLDKKRPVLVYCLSGGRSASAAKLMASQGFTDIFNLEGGILLWNAANKPLETGALSNTQNGLTFAEVNKLVSSNQFVLVDYNAKWCKPCRKMAPMLEAFVNKRKNKVILLKIDADENKDLLPQKGIASIPVLELYKNGKLVWKHAGEIDEQKLTEELYSDLQPGIICSDFPPTAVLNNISRGEGDLITGTKACRDCLYCCSYNFQFP